MLAQGRKTDTESFAPMGADVVSYSEHIDGTPASESPVDRSGHAVPHGRGKPRICPRPCARIFTNLLETKSVPRGQIHYGHGGLWAAGGPAEPRGTGRRKAMAIGDKGRGHGFQSSQPRSRCKPPLHSTSSTWKIAEKCWQKRCLTSLSGMDWPVSPCSEATWPCLKPQGLIRAK